MILTAIIPAFDLIWKLMLQMSLSIKFFPGSQVSSTKKKMDEKADLANSAQPTVWILPSYRGRLGSTLASFLEDGDVKTSDSWHPQCFLYEKLHKGLNTTNWTEVSLVPCQLQKITREASQMLSMNRMRRYFPSRDLKDVRWKRLRTTWSSQSNVRCSVS